MSRPTVTRFKREETYAGRTVRKATVDKRSVRSFRQGRSYRPMRPMR